MLRPASMLTRLSIAAVDGDIGSVHDLYFDDRSWTVRYMVVDTGAWLSGRRVLISPRSVRETRERVSVHLTRDQVRSSPDVDTDKPVNRQQEEAIARHSEQPYSWEGPSRWGLLAYPGMPPVPAPTTVDSALRSTREVTGYRIAAQDGEIGHVDDFLVGEPEWAIQSLVVDTRTWWIGKKVMVSPEAIRAVRWADSTVEVALARDEIRASAEYAPGRP